MEYTDFFSAKNLIKRWYLLGLFKLSMIFQELENMIFRAVFIIGFYFNFYVSPNNKVYCGRDLVVCIFVLFNFLCKRIIKKKNLFQLLLLLSYCHLDMFSPICDLNISLSSAFLGLLILLHQLASLKFCSSLEVWSTAFWCSYC